MAVVVGTDLRLIELEVALAYPGDEKTKVYPPAAPTIAKSLKVARPFPSVKR
jgi:hypothetical protein